ncbi:MAG: ATP-binding protein [Bacteroidales bacterium]|nr:ATP-binding protein [Bacteroidales bacterium]
MNNPFVTNGYAGAEYFCDRVRETAALRELLLNENNVALISPRRLGKTDLIWHVFDDKEIRRKYHCFVVDIYATKNLGDLVNMLGKAVLDELRPKGRKVWEKFVNVVSSLRPEISFDINGMPTWSVGLGSINNPAVSLDEIFRFLEQADKPCLVAIDEFQQIIRYDDPTVEATIRTYVQRCTNAHFIFSGSQRHMMNEMFTSPSRPFYQAVSIMNLQPLDLDVYTDFCVNKFEVAGKHLEREVVAVLYERFEAITSYMHRVLNVLYSRTEKGSTCVPQMVDDAIDFLIRMSSDTYESLLYQMPEKQRMLFLAIAREGKATAVTGGRFINRHKLSSASSVTSALKGLLEKDFITVDRNVYGVYDRFFALWLNFKGLI